MVHSVFLKKTLPVFALFLTSCTIWPLVRKDDVRDRLVVCGAGLSAELTAQILAEYDGAKHQDNARMQAAMEASTQLLSWLPEDRVLSGYREYVKCMGFSEVTSPAGRTVGEGAIVKDGSLVAAGSFREAQGVILAETVTLAPTTLGQPEQDLERGTVIEILERQTAFSKVRLSSGEVGLVPAATIGYERIDDGDTCFVADLESAIEDGLVKVEFLGTLLNHGPSIAMLLKPKVKLRVKLCLRDSLAGKVVEPEDFPGEDYEPNSDKSSQRMLLGRIVGKWDGSNPSKPLQELLEELLDAAKEQILGEQESDDSWWRNAAFEPSAEIVLPADSSMVVYLLDAYCIDSGLNPPAIGEALILSETSVDPLILDVLSGRHSSELKQDAIWALRQNELWSDPDRRCTHDDAEIGDLLVSLGATAKKYPHAADCINPAATRSKSE